MKNQISSKVMIASFAGILMFSLGFMPVTYAGIDQGILTINSNCATSAINQDMDFGTADAGDQVVGNFDVTNSGNDIANIEIQVTSTSGDWVDSGSIPIIDASDTLVSDGIFSNTLDNSPIALSPVQPDAVNPGNNDLTVDITTDVNLLTAFSGDVTLDITLVNIGCGTVS